MGTPLGESFTVTIDGAEQTYVIRPRVFSDHVIDALLAIHRQQLRNQQYEILEDLSARQKDGKVSASLVSSIQDKLVEALTKQSEEIDPEVHLNAAIRMLMTREGKIEALVHCCDSIRDPQHAGELVDAYGNDMELFMLLAKAGSEGFEAGKNFDLLEKSEEILQNQNQSPETNLTDDLQLTPE